MKIRQQQERELEEAGGDISSGPPPLPTIPYVSILLLFLHEIEIEDTEGCWG